MTSTSDSPIARLDRSQRRLLWSFIPATAGIYALWGAIPGILLPLQIGAIDEDHKAANLALVATLGACAAMLAQPIAGVLSDRTRSRYGRRAPWILGGALCGGLALLVLSMSSTLAAIALAWIAAQIAYNLAQGPLSAVLPDRVPRSARGTFSAAIGVATMTGVLLGSGAAAAFSGHIPAGYLTFAAVALLAVTLFVLLNPDRASLGDERLPFDARTFLRTFWVNPRAHPDFGWAFLGRLLLYTGYFVVYGYQLYLLEDYIGVDDRAAQLVPVLGLVSLPAMLLSIAICGPLSDRVGRRKPFIAVSSAVVATGVLIPWVWPTVPGMVAFAVVCGFGFGAFQAVDTALITEVLPSSADFGKDLGVVNIAATLPQTFAPALTGVIVLSAGYSGLFPIAALLSLLGACAVYPIKAVR
ncbi:MFS transporter [Nocardia sp. NPDC051832]|uniref:MFS transporter n=1 Tax=Nocardia sp. NPDC051832 TaxID=3155673 RepID=UPI00341FC29E